MVTSHMAIILVVSSTKSLVDSTSLRYVYENVASALRLKACTRNNEVNHESSHKFCVLNDNFICIDLQKV